MRLFRRNKIGFTDNFVGQIYITPSQKITRVDYLYDKKSNELQVFVDGERITF